MEQTTIRRTTRANPQESFPYRLGEEWTVRLVWNPDAALYLVVLPRDDGLREYLVLRREKEGLNGKDAALDSVCEHFPLTVMEQRRLKSGNTEPVAVRLFPSKGISRLINAKIRALPYLPANIMTLLSDIHQKIIPERYVDYLLQNPVLAYR